MTSRLHTPICERFDCEYPVFGFAHSLPVAAAITNAGGVGIWGATRQTPEEIDEGLAWLAAQTGGRPFGVDLVLPQGMPERDDRAAMEAGIPDEHRRFVSSIRQKYQVPDDGQPGARSRFVRSQQMADRQIEAVLASPVTFFGMGVGSPTDAVAAAKASGKTVVSLVGTPRHAERAVQAGADLIVAQGYDAGAHTGEIGTFSLVPQVVDAVGDTPVLAAGGVATGRHVAAAYALGAVGVWVGTAWLFTREHNLDPIIFDKLAKAQSDDTVRSRADSGKTLRQIRTSWTAEWERPGAPQPLKMPYQDILVGDLLGAVDRHQITDLMHHPAGQSVAYFDHETDVATVMSSLVEAAEQSIATLCGGSEEC